MLFKSKPVVSPQAQILTTIIQVGLTACLVHAYSYAAAKGWQLGTDKTSKDPKAEAVKKQKR